MSAVRPRYSEARDPEEQVDSSLLNISLGDRGRAKASNRIFVSYSSIAFCRQEGVTLRNRGGAKQASRAEDAEACLKVSCFRLSCRGSVDTQRLHATGSAMAPLWLILFCFI